MSRVNLKGTWHRTKLLCTSVLKNMRLLRFARNDGERACNDGDQFGDLQCCATSAWLHAREMRWYTTWKPSMP